MESNNPLLGDILLDFSNLIGLNHDETMLLASLRGESQTMTPHLSEAALTRLCSQLRTKPDHATSTFFKLLVKDFARIMNYKETQLRHLVDMMLLD